MILETPLAKEIGKLDNQITAMRIDLKILELQRELLIDPDNIEVKAIETIGADNLKRYYFRIEEED